MTENQHLEAFGDEAVDDSDSDFASEHADTVVDTDVTAEDGDDGETESPHGFAGLDRDGPP